MNAVNAVLTKLSVMFWCLIEAISMRFGAYYVVDKDGKEVSVEIDENDFVSMTFTGNKEGIVLKLANLGEVANILTYSSKDGGFAADSLVIENHGMMCKIIRDNGEETYCQSFVITREGTDRWCLSADMLRETRYKIFFDEFTVCHVD